LPLHPPPHTSTLFPYTTLFRSHNFREALAMQRRLLGDRHPDVAWSFYHVAGILLNRGKLVEAEAESREAVTKFTALAGKNKPVYPLALDLLTDVLRAEGKFAQAAALAQEALAKREAVLNE